MAHPNRWSYMGVHLLLQAHPHSFRWVNAYSCVASWSPHHRRHPFPSCLLHNALRLCAPATLPVPMCTYPACPNVYLPCLAQCVPTLPGPMCTYPAWPNVYLPSSNMPAFFQLCPSSLGICLPSLCHACLLPLALLPDVFLLLLTACLPDWRFPPAPYLPACPLPDCPLVR